MVGQAEISAMVRAQPRHSGVAEPDSVDFNTCMTQTWLQGDAGSGSVSGQPTVRAHCDDGVIALISGAFVGAFCICRSVSIGKAIAGL